MTSSPDAPVRIGRYELALALPAGPLGELWAGAATEGVEQGRVVAVRRVRFGGTVPALRAHSAKAAEIARGLRHPKVAAVLDVVELEDELVVVSEHVDGESLGALLKHAIGSKSPIPPGVALAIVRDAADGLIAMRDHFAKSPGAPDPFGGLVPDGLTVAAFGETMLTEPGVLAALGDAAVRLSALPYRAPEQLGAPPGRDEKTEVYGLGALLWEMLANRGLYRSTAKGEADAEAELRRKIMTEAAPTLDELPRQGAPLPASLVVLVSRALSRDPGQRYAGLEAFRKALDDLPRDTVAAPEQVAVTLERLARHTLEARRAALGQMGDGRLSISTESSRATARPASPEAPMEVVMPPLARSPAPSIDTFTLQEAPTRPRRKLTPASLPIPEGLPPAKPAEPEAPPRARESTASGVSVSEEPLGAPRSGARRFAPLIVVAVGVIAIGFAVLMRSSGSDREAPAVAPSAGPAPTASAVPEPTVTASGTTAPEPEPPASASAAAAPSASATRPRPRDDRPAPKASAQGGFRPKGI
ncbi:MAG: hypothetical protein HYZ29_29165 [Myxococcales bacterium]|nr:hypothetical protein [Myxococcales bacterium]